MKTTNIKEFPEIFTGIDSVQNIYGICLKESEQAICIVSSRHSLLPFEEESPGRVTAFRKKILYLHRYQNLNQQT